MAPGGAQERLQVDVWTLACLQVHMCVCVAWMQVPYFGWRGPISSKLGIAVHMVYTCVCRPTLWVAAFSCTQMLWPPSGWRCRGRRV